MLFRALPGSFEAGLVKQGHSEVLAVIGVVMGKHVFVQKEGEATVALMWKAAPVCFLMTLQHIGMKFSHR